ncbi:hypothetical protein [Cellulomonas alba]|uniref:Uncharacterized protein n=1 Tax=Cellulomonas alba TaxID=3053467 RepID=A0ABT7SCW6_9CELL|nr:hypothetical protein [Cellulomonas alba]MDM7853894.1 hypothetical protein [Cellulomonas alba]
MSQAFDTDQPATPLETVNAEKLRDEISRLSQRLARARQSYDQDLFHGETGVPLEMQLAVIEGYTAKLEALTERLRLHEEDLRRSLVPQQPTPAVSDLPSAVSPAEPAPAPEPPSTVPAAQEWSVPVPAAPQAWPAAVSEPPAWPVAVSAPPEPVAAVQPPQEWPVAVSEPPSALSPPLARRTPTTPPADRAGEAPLARRVAPQHVAPQFVPEPLPPVAEPQPTQPIAAPAPAWPTRSGPATPDPGVPFNEEAAIGEYVRLAAELRWLTTHRPSLVPEYAGPCEAVLARLAQAHGVGVDEERQSLVRQVDARFRRDYG